MFYPSMSRKQNTSDHKSNMNLICVWSVSSYFASGGKLNFNFIGIKNFKDKLDTILYNSLCKHMRARDSNVLSSVIRQKYKSQNGCFKKTKPIKFSEKWTFLTPWRVRARPGGKKCSFFGKLGQLYFLDCLTFFVELYPVPTLI